MGFKNHRTINKEEMACSSNSEASSATAFAEIHITTGENFQQ